MLIFVYSIWWKRIIYHTLQLSQDGALRAFSFGFLEASFCESLAPPNRRPTLTSFAGRWIKLNLEEI
jgi:hypothetical protein